MYFPQTYRILFPDTYLTSVNLVWVTSAPALPIFHEPRSNEVLYDFGGVSDESTNPFFYFIRLSQIPDGLGITSVKSLDLGVHIRRFDDLGYCVYYQHDEKGSPSFMDSEVNVVNQLSEQPCDLGMNDIGPILETNVTLSPIDSDRAQSEWDIMTQLGGVPTWVQGEDIPLCPLTKRPMRFLLSLACSCVPATDSQYGFYSEGVFYVFWADQTRVSAVIYQQT